MLELFDMSAGSKGMTLRQVSLSLHQVHHFQEYRANRACDARERVGINVGCCVILSVMDLQRNGREAIRFIGTSKDHLPYNRLN